MLTRCSLRGNTRGRRKLISTRWCVTRVAPLCGSNISDPPLSIRSVSLLSLPPLLQRPLLRLLLHRNRRFEVSCRRARDAAAIAVRPQPVVSFFARRGRPSLALSLCSLEEDGGGGVGGDRPLTDQPLISLARGETAPSAIAASGDRAPSAVGSDSAEGLITIAAT